MGKLLNDFRVPAKFETLRSFDSCNVSCCAPLLGYADYSGPTSDIFAFKGLIVKALASRRRALQAQTLRHWRRPEDSGLSNSKTQRECHNIYYISWLSNGF